MSENAIHPDVNAITLMLDSLDQQSATYRVRLREVRDDFSEKTVHDLRTCIRRLQGTGELAGHVVSYAGVQKLYNDLDEQLDVFGALRDTQVMLDSIKENRSVQLGFEPFHEYLKQREKDLSDEAEKFSRSLKPGTVNKRLLQIRERLTSCSGPTEQEVRGRMLQAVDNAYRTVMQRYWEIDSKESDSIHQLRVEFKKFRYMVEVVQAILPGFPTAMLERIHEYQTRMGAVQDAKVCLTTLADFAAQTASNELFPLRRYYERILSYALSDYIEHKNELLDFWRATALSEFPWEATPVAEKEKG